MKLRDFNKLYFAFLFFHLVVIYKPESQLLYYISKPLLLFSLLAFFMNKNAPLQSLQKVAVVGALLFSLAGDVLLMFSGEHFFLAGMAAFFAAHVGYFIFYSKQGVPFKLAPLALAIALSAMAFWAMHTIIQLPAGLGLYLYIYAAIISVHFILATLFSFAYKGTQWLSAAGALLFIVSDFFVAYNAFNEYNTYVHLFVMLTYGVAQYSIVISINDYLARHSASIDTDKMYIKNED